LSEFGDIDPDDPFDAETVLDPEQVARRLQEERVAAGLLVPDWDDLEPEQRAKTVVAVAAVILWLHRQGAVR
jgi:hypothetical protein